MHVNRTRRRLSLAVILCLAVIFTVSGSVSAVDQEWAGSLADDNTEPSTRMVYINQVSTSMSFSTSGITASGYILAYPGTVDKVSIYLYLERYENGQWVSFASWSRVANTYYAYLERFTSASYSYYYRVRGSYYAWSGSSYEHVTGYSSVGYYS